MDRSLIELFAPSAEFEAFVPHLHRATLDSFELLHELGAIARKSVQATLPVPSSDSVPSSNPAPSTGPAPLPAAQPVAKPVFSTETPEYRPALRDQALVQALLGLHAESREAPVPPPPRAKSPLPASASQGEANQPSPQELAAHFRPARIHSVDPNELKLKPRSFFLKTPVISQSILRADSMDDAKAP